MRRRIMGTLITAFAMMGVGLALMCSAVALYGTELVIGEENFMEKTHTITEKVTFLKVSDAESDIRILPSSDGTCTVRCYDRESIFHTVTLDGQTLTVEQVDGRKWYEKIGFFLWWTQPRTVTVYLPLGEYKTLTLKTVSGDIQVPDGYIFSSGELKTTSGNISFESEVRQGLVAQTTSGDVTLREMGADTVVAKTTSGDVRLEGVQTSGAVTATTTSGKVSLSKVICGDLQASVTSGDVTLSEVEAWGNLTVSSTSGDISFDYIGAHKDMKFSAVSGDVEGTMVGRKNFSVKTVSGSVSVPQSGGFGQCRIETTSGDVQVRIYE